MHHASAGWAFCGNSGCNTTSQPAASAARAAIGINQTLRQTAGCEPGVGGHQGPIYKANPLHQLQTLRKRPLPRFVKDLNKKEQARRGNPRPPLSCSKGQCTECLGYLSCLQATSVHLGPQLPGSGPMRNARFRHQNS